MDGHFFPGAQQQQQQQFLAPAQQQQPQFPPQFQYGYVPQPQQFPFIPAAPAAPAPPPAPAFFNTWEPAPIPVPPPADTELHKRIDKLVEFSAKNGPVFEALMRDKQREDPAYSFLFGGDGHLYYKYKLWITLNPHLVPFNPAMNLVSPPVIGIPAAPPPPQLQVVQPGVSFPGFFDPGMMSGSQPQQQQQLVFEQPAPPPIMNTLPVEMAAELRSLLESLNGSKDSIITARTWFTQRSTFAPLLADALRERVTGSDNVETQLQVLYLINDILFSSLQLRINVKELDAEALAFSPVLGRILGAIYKNQNISESDREKVEKILHFWGTSEVYDPETVKSLDKEMKPADATAHKQWPQEQKTGDSAGASNTSSSSSVAALFPSLAPFLSPAIQQPASTSSARADQTQYPHFPPGLIPGMVRKMQIGSGVPYSPLSPVDIPAIIPTGASSESYMVDRVTKFYKEIGETDPLAGSYMDLEPEERDEEEKGRGARIPPPPQLQVDSETGTLPDGSVEHRAGMTSSGRLGLGASADPNEATPYDDVYTSYRKQRSTNYHTSMSARAAAAAR